MNDDSRQCRTTIGKGIGRHRYPSSDTDFEGMGIRAWHQGFKYECEGLIKSSGIRGVNSRNLAFQRSECRHGKKGLGREYSVLIFLPYKCRKIDCDL